MFYVMLHIRKFNCHQLFVISQAIKWNLRTTAVQLPIILPIISLYHWQSSLLTAMGFKWLNILFFWKQYTFWSSDSITRHMKFSILQLCTLQDYYWPSHLTTKIHNSFHGCDQQFIELLPFYFCHVNTSNATVVSIL